jgi:hypothetical protein
MLRALIELSRHYRFAVSELAGGSHSGNSLHYRGVAFDVNAINGSRVGLQHPDVKALMQDCRDLGADQVIGPMSAGHATHVHAAWRPMASA